MARATASEWDGRRPTRMPSSRPSSCPTGSGSPSAGRELVLSQGDDDCRSTADTIADGDPPPKQLRIAPDDPESDPKAGVCAGRRTVELPEFLEGHVARLGRHADAGVGHPDREASVVF